MIDIGTTGLLAPGRLRWLRAIGWMIALAAGLVVTFNAVAKACVWLLAVDAGKAFDMDKLIAACAGAVAILLLYWVAVRFAERRRVSELSLRQLPAELMLGSVIGAALIGLIIGLLWLVGWVLIEPQPVSRIALALRDSIRSGVVEEVLLRLVIFRLLWRGFGIWPALVISSALFGVLHLANPDSSLFAALALAAGEGIGIGLYLITGRIWASIGMHGAWNFTQGWVFGAVVSGTTDIAGGPLSLRPAAGAPDLMSGGGFGPEASLAALIVSLLASAALLWWPWTRGRFVAAAQPASG
ncbi:MAG: CPBP family intramembrane metalloprotease [Sphingomonas bacterium]|nr:CPBP family intramembrane metalloprotease [Sphingomonas bacterium]